MARLPSLTMHEPTKAEPKAERGAAPQRGRGVVFYLPQHQQRAFKIALASCGMTLQQAGEEMWRDWMAKKGERVPE